MIVFFMLILIKFSLLMHTETDEVPPEIGAVASIGSVTLLPAADQPAEVG